MNKKLSNLITVGIPFHCKSNPIHLKEAIDSIITQTVQPKTIHLIQDGKISLDFITLFLFKGGYHLLVSILFLVSIFSNL